jgi:hypothetical protein
MNTFIFQCSCKKGLPVDPNVANEYYNMSIQDFEEDSSPERYQSRNSTLRNSAAMTRNSMSRTVVPQKNRRIKTSVPSSRKPGSTYLNNNNTSTNRDILSPKSNIIKQQQNVASKTISNSQPRSSVATRTEYEHLIGALSGQNECKMLY